MTDAFSSMFRQATESFQTAVETGARAQKDAMTFFTRPFFGENTPDTICDCSQRMTDASMRLIRKNLDETHRVIDTQCRQGMELLKKTFDAAKPDEKADMFDSARTMWQSTFDAMRAGVEQFAKSNAQALDNLSEFVTNAMETCRSNGHAEKAHEKKAAAVK